jgi:hypothetical protein
MVLSIKKHVLIYNKKDYKQNKYFNIKKLLKTNIKILRKSIH